MVMRCARLGREATESECCEVIVATRHGRDLDACRTCARGMALAASASLGKRRAVAPAAPGAPGASARAARNPGGIPQISRTSRGAHAPASLRRSGQGHTPPAPPGPFEIEALARSSARLAAPKESAKAEKRQAASPAPAPARAVAPEGTARAMGRAAGQKARAAAPRAVVPPLLAALIDALAYAIPRYKGQADLGLKFTAMLIQDRAGLECAWCDLERLCLEQGLTLNRRKGSAFVALDETARALAGRMG